MDNRQQNKWLKLLLLTVLLVFPAAYISITPREDFSLLIGLYSAMFLAYVLLVKYKIELREIILIGIVARIALFFTAPNLSNDFYRFVFDGHLIIEGINPYRVLPGYYYTSNADLNALIGQINSPEYYSIYPPLNQLLFTPFAALYFKSEILAIDLIRTFLLLADLLSVYFIIKISGWSIINKHILSVLYFLNPLIIIEFTGNLHFEGVVICFILASIYFLYHKKLFQTGLFIGMAFLTKLTPLIVLPFLIKSTSGNSYWRIIAGFVVVSLLIIFPFYDSEILKNIFSSVELFFHRFEFNASIYYLFREIGELITGYNQIKYLGPTLWIITALLIIWKWDKQINGVSNIWPSLLMAFSVLFFLSTTVHPWYVSLVLLPGIFLGYLFPIVWTFTIFLSYSAYSSSPVHEEFVLLILEYSVVFAILIWELIKGPSLKKFIAKT